MADEEAQGPEETSWWADDAFSDPSSPATPFDEPLVWPDMAAWNTAEPMAPSLIDDAGIEGDLLFPTMPDLTLGQPDLRSDLDAAWGPGADADADAVAVAAAPLAGLGGGGGQPPAPDDAAPSGWPEVDEPVPAPVLPADEPLPQSIWSNASHDDVAPTALSTGAFYAEAERRAHGPRWRRFDVRSGNAAVIALISVVSLVLLGMFLSVRARNNVTTDASQPPRPAGDQLEITGSLNTIPLTTTPSTTPGINLSDLVPTTETTLPSAAGSGTAPATTATPRTTAAPARAATTTPTTETPATSPPTPETTAPPVTSPPDTTVTTTRPRTTTTFTTPTYTIPTFPTTSTPRPFPR